MKINKMFTIAVLLLVVGCKHNDEAAFLPGIYVCQTENEFCRVSDTLVIRKKGLGSAEYQVTRNSSFQRIREGKAQSPEVQGDEWQAGYDPSNKVLLSPGKTKEIRYSPDDNKLTKGEWVYEKVE